MAESSNLKKTNLSQQDSSNPAFDSLLKKAKKYLDKDQISMLKKAYEFSFLNHKGQLL